jgi:hypothetical protein
MCGIMEKAIADRRDPYQKSSSVASKAEGTSCTFHMTQVFLSNAYEPHVLLFLTYTSELISTSPGVTLSRKSSAVDHWLLSCKTSRSSGLRIITTGTVPPSTVLSMSFLRQ